jgi:hypothetical protein
MDASIMYLSCPDCGSDRCSALHDAIVELVIYRSNLQFTQLANKFGLQKKNLMSCFIASWAHFNLCRRSEVYAIRKRFFVVLGS